MTILKILSYDLVKHYDDLLTSLQVEILELPKINESVVIVKQRLCVMWISFFMLYVFCNASPRRPMKVLRVKARKTGLYYRNLSYF